MTVVLRASDLIGKPVVSIADGEDIAEIRDVVFDGDRHELVGFTLNKRGFFHGRVKELLPSAGVVGLGPDAVMVRDGADLADPGAVADQLARPPRARSVIGVDVVTEAGVELGHITEVILAAGDRAEAVGYEVGGGNVAGRNGNRVFVPIDAQIALSGSALVLPAEAASYVRDDLAGFGSAIEQYRALRAGGRMRADGDPT